MSKIYLINGNTTRAVESLVTAHVRDSLDSEFTLSFTLTADDADYISDTTKVQYNGQHFGVIGYGKDTDGQSPVCAVECEHISYELNNDEYTLDNFVFSGTPAAALTAVLSGTPFTAGIVEPSANVNISITGGTRRAVLISVAALMGGEIEYDGYAINIRNHRGSTQYIDLLGTYNVTHVSLSRSVRENLTAYTITLGRKTTLAAGDNIHIEYNPLGIDVNTRIIAIEYNPYRDSEVDIEVGDYVPDILDAYAATAQAADAAQAAAVSAEQAAQAAQTAAETASETAEAAQTTANAIAADYTKATELYAGIEAYIDTAAGTASIVSACSGTYLVEDDISGLTTETDVQNIILQEISKTGGSIKLYVEGKQYITRATADGRYTKATELYAGIKAYIDTAAGTASIVSACSGTYQTQSGMDAYPTTVEMNTSITQSVNNKFATLTLSTSASASGNQTSSTITLKSGASPLGSSVTISATTATQAATIAASAVNGITLSATNGATSSTLSLKNGNATIDSVSITFTGFVTFTALSTSGSTTINGSNITTGTIDASKVTVTKINASNITTGTLSADRIDASNIRMSVLYAGSGTTAAITGTSNALYIGGSSSNVNITTLNLCASNHVYIGTGYTSYGRILFDVPNRIIRATNTSYTWNLGSASTPFGSAYANTFVAMTSAKLGNTTQSALGFFGATPRTRIMVNTVSTSAAVGVVAAGLNTLITALKNYGLIS